MAISAPLIFDEIEITDAGGGTAEQYANHLVDSAEVTPEPTSSKVGDGQTLTDFYDVEYAVNLYELGILDDARVYTNSSEEPVRADIIFKKATGAVQLVLSNVIINGTRTYDGNRVQSRVFGSKRSVQISDAITES
jgi:hypothetical protein